MRPPEQIRQHTFLEALDGSPRLIEAALAAKVSATTDGQAITAEVTIQSQNAGHAIPTGDPIRSLVLVVRAEGCGAPLTAVGGMTTNDVAGAVAEGLVGADVKVAGATLTWPEGAARAKPGQVVRFVHPTGEWDDYAGVGFFADKALSPMEKGLEIRAPLGEAKVVSVGAVKACLPTVYVDQPAATSLTLAASDTSRIYIASTGEILATLEALPPAGSLALWSVTTDSSGVPGTPTDLRAWYGDPGLWSA